MALEYLKVILYCEDGFQFEITQVPGEERLVSTALRLTVDEFDRMIDADVFHDNRRIELVRGELRTMNALGPNHEYVTVLLTRWSYENLPKRQAQIRVQNSIGLESLDSVPEPDVAWVSERVYAAKRPSAKDVFLVIEVADSSRAYDLGDKRDLYANARISEYWVVDIPKRCVHVFRKPLRGVYRDVTIAHEEENVRPLAFPKMNLRVGTLFEF